MSVTNDGNGNNGSDGFYRIWDIIGCPQRRIKPLLPVSASTWWAGVASGRFPKGIKLGRKLTVWRQSDIHNWLRCQ